MHVQTWAGVGRLVVVGSIRCHQEVAPPDHLQVVFMVGFMQPVARVALRVVLIVGGRMQ